MSGAPWSYDHWGEGEPNQAGNEDCGAFDPQNENYGVSVFILYLNIEIRFHEISCASHSHFQWMDLDCSSANHGVPHYAVCEKLIA